MCDFRIGRSHLRKRLRESWKPLSRSKPSTSATSSISDTDGLGYLKIVERAIAEETSLLNFRAEPDYQEILEHVSVRLGQKYLDEILSHFNPEPSKVFSSLTNLSEFGNPPVHMFSNIGAVSPTILRYVKVAYEMQQLFGDLSRLRIGEIGVGFGGQAAVLNRLFGVSEYIAFDLPDVLRLFQLFLSRTKTSLSISLVDGRHPEPKELDLVISNYAFSELSRNVQEQYLSKVILRAKSGYMIWNNLSSTQLDGYSLKELCRKIPGSMVLKEVPRSARTNRLIVWGLAPDFLAP